MAAATENENTKATNTCEKSPYSTQGFIIKHDIAINTLTLASSIQSYHIGSMQHKIECVSIFPWPLTNIEQLVLLLLLLDHMHSTCFCISTYRLMLFTIFKLFMKSSCWLFLSFVPFVFILLRISHHHKIKMDGWKSELTRMLPLYYLLRNSSCAEKMLIISSKFPSYFPFLMETLEQQQQKQTKQCYQNPSSIHTSTTWIFVKYLKERDQTHTHTSIGKYVFSERATVSSLVCTRELLASHLIDHRTCMHVCVCVCIHIWIAFYPLGNNNKALDG